MIKTRVFSTSMDKRGFITTLVSPGAEISLQDAHENTEAVLRLSDGKNYPILVDLREIRSITKESRDYFSMKNRKPNVTAIAMVVSKPVSMVIGNFFMGINKPIVPTKMFLDEDKAVKWLLSQ